MKRVLIYSIALALGALMWSCKEDGLDWDSVYVDNPREPTKFDLWLEREYVVPYNCRVVYRWQDIETDQSFWLTPAREDGAKIVAVIMKHMWIDAFSEGNTRGVDFMREYGVNILQIIGSGGYRDDSSMILGTAQAGKKITMYVANRYNLADPTTYNPWFMLQDKQVIMVTYHEFTHTMNQMVLIPSAFAQVSVGDYRDNGYTEYTDEESLEAGFYTQYSRHSVGEDVADMTALYICTPRADWDARVASAGEEGASKINRKLEILKKYYVDAFGIDLDNMNSIVQRRASELQAIIPETIANM